MVWARSRALGRGAKNVGHRKIERIEWANPLASRPACIPQAKRLRGTKALGVSFEKHLARALDRAMPNSFDHGRWFEFLADGKRGFCQPDFVLVHPLTVTIIECKLTNIEEATEQLDDLYFPVLAAAYRLPVRGIIAVKSLSRLPRGREIVVCTSLREALQTTLTRVPILHWLGRGPI